MTTTTPHHTKQPCPVHLLDGGLGTLLTSTPHNVTFNTNTPLWSSHLLITSPSTLLAAQRSFVDAGADVIITATYQASSEGFVATPSISMNEIEVGRAMRSAVYVARKAFGDVDEGKGGKGERGKRGKGKVALSLGAYGASMIPSEEYSGLYDEGHTSIDSLRDWHLHRLSVFLPRPISPSNSENERGEMNEEELKERKRCWDDIDILAFETIPLLNEILAARQVIHLSQLHQNHPYHDPKPFWISCVFPPSAPHHSLPDGTPIPKLVQAMLSPKEGMATPTGIGINCTKVSKIEGLVLEFEAAVKEMVDKGELKVESSPSLVLYPDGTQAGEVYNTVTKEWVISDQGKEKEVEGQKDWDEEVFGIVMRARERGLWKSIYVGGCCRTGPEEIARLRKRIDGVL